MSPAGESFIFHLMPYSAKTKVKLKLTKFKKTLELWLNCSLSFKCKGDVECSPGGKKYFFNVGGGQ